MLLFSFAFLIILSLRAQTECAALQFTHCDHGDELSANFSCGYTGEDILFDKNQNFASVQEAVQVITDIMNAVGLRANFKVQAAKVQNAAAVVMGEERYILYSPAFMQRVERSTQTRWAGISIMAHEIGHHLQGHTLTKNGSRPGTELEADEFSGFVLRKMGASLEEAQAAMAKLANPIGTMTHPPRNQRLTAIGKGWNRADRSLGGTTVGISRRPNARESNPTTVPETPVAASSPDRERVRPGYAQWRVNLTRNPNSDYFITTANHFVLQRGKRVFQLGTVMRTGDRRFPYVIDMENSDDLFLSRSGKLFTRNGKEVGRLENV